MIAISVVIPHYNAPEALKRAIDSVLEQSVPPLEIIVVDDASSEASRSQYRTWISKLSAESRVTLVELQTNSGPSVARNVGWERAAGSHISFLDADDAWHPQKLEYVERALNQNPEINLLAHRYSIRTDERDPAAISSPSLIWLADSDWLRGNCASTPTVTVPRSLSHRFSENLGYAEDYDLWLRIHFSERNTATLDAHLTYLYKPAYGSSGLSSAMWRMEKGELQALRNLYRSGYLSVIRLSLVSCWSLVKFTRRLLVVSLRKAFQSRR